ncbi:glycoside hydrolase domain-containing protein, partial [Stenotrophomonas sp. BIIR7]|uniref:glycoside hydrolase domain-containing protein n=3 Tax=Stenotrophomonas TaxID=40323 RepID=UPI00114D3779
SAEYIIGRPFLPKAVLNLPNGKTFRITTEGMGKGHEYVGSVTLNGKPLNRTFLRHAEIMAGGELHFTLQADANTAWPGQGAEQPYSMSH